MKKFVWKSPQQYAIMSSRIIFKNEVWEIWLLVGGTPQNIVVKVASFKVGPGVLVRITVDAQTIEITSPEGNGSFGGWTVWHPIPAKLLPTPKFCHP